MKDTENKNISIDIETYVHVFTIGDELKKAIKHYTLNRETCISKYGYPHKWNIDYITNIKDYNTYGPKTAEELREAIKHYYTDKKSCLYKYCHLKNWDAEDITNISNYAHLYSKLDCDIARYVHIFKNEEELIEVVKNVLDDTSIGFYIYDRFNNWDISNITDMSLEDYGISKYNYNIASMMNMKFMCRSTVVCDVPSILDWEPV